MRAIACAVRVIVLAACLAAFPGCGGKSLWNAEEEPRPEDVEAVLGPGTDTPE